MSKRNNLEISSDILKTAINGARKSHIVYQTNLNFKIAEKYLNQLSKSGLLTGSTKGRRIYSTTEKGLKYLDYLEGIEEYISQTSTHTYSTSINVSKTT